MSKRRTAVWVIVFLIFIAASIGVAVAVQQIQDYTFTQIQIQEKINARLPLSKNGITVTSMNVVLRNGVIAVDTQVEGKKLTQRFTATLHTTGELVYNNLEGSFHLKPRAVEVAELQIGDKPISKKVEKFIDTFVSSKKIVANKAEIGQKLEKAVHDKIEGAIVWALERTPIYTLPDNLQGTAARMVLKGIEIKEGSITAHLSLWQFTKMAILYLFVLLVVIALVIFLFMSPEWGLAAAAIGGTLDV